MEKQIEKLTEVFYEYLRLPYEEAVLKSKIEEAKKIKFKYDDKYYRNKVFINVSDNTLDDFQIDVEFCEKPDQHDLWEYFRVHTSSIRTNKNIGRNIRILVKHVKTQKYIGILSLASDIMNCEARDLYIGWKINNNKNNLKYIMNITTCVGLQPIAFNFNIGKLLVATCFSSKVLSYFKNK